MLISSSGGQVSSGHSSHGKFGLDTSYPLSRLRFTGNIPCKPNGGNNTPYIDYCGPCPVHPTLSHAWGDYGNNPRHKSVGGQHTTVQ